MTFVTKPFSKQNLTKNMNIIKDTNNSSTWININGKRGFYHGDVCHKPWYICHFFAGTGGNPMLVSVTNILSQPCHGNSSLNFNMGYPWQKPIPKFNLKLCQMAEAQSRKFSRYWAGFCSSPSFLWVSLTLYLMLEVC